MTSWNGKSYISQILLEILAIDFRSCLRVLVVHVGTRLLSKISREIWSGIREWKRMNSFAFASADAGAPHIHREVIGDGLDVSVQPLSCVA